MRAICVACGDHDMQRPMLVCFQCRDDLRQCLDDVLLWHEAMLEPPVRPRNGGGSPSTASGGDIWPDDNPSLGVAVRTSPANDKVIEVRTHIRQVLWVWASVYIEELAPGSALYPGGEASEYVRYLRNGEALLLAHPDYAEQYVHAVARLAHEAQRTAAPGRRDGIILGVHNDGDCDGGNVWAGRLRGKARCAGCSRTWSMEEWHEQNPPSADDPLTDEEVIREIAFVYGHPLTLNAIMIARHRGQLLPLPDKKWNRIATARGEVWRYASNRWNSRLAV